MNSLSRRAALRKCGADTYAAPNAKPTRDVFSIVRDREPLSDGRLVRDRRRSAADRRKTQTADQRGHPVIDPVQELDMVLRADADGRWVIYQRRGSTDALIRGPFQTRTQAEQLARTLKETVGANAFVQIGPDQYLPL